MQELTFAFIALTIVLYGLISGRVTKTVITPPMVFVGAGILMSILGLLELEPNQELIILLAEFTLIQVLFTDASRIDLRSLIGRRDLPFRTLLIGLPLVIATGTLIGAVVFPNFTWAEVAILAVVLAPTDAALAQSVINSRRVPVRIRQAINVESGLNDGLALPVLLLFASLVASGGGEEGLNLAGWLQLAGLQLLLGPLIGLGVGYLGGRGIRWSSNNTWMTEAFERLSALGLALLAFAAAEVVGGNGFLAAFLAGLTVGNVAREASDHIHEFAEAEGQLLTLLTFLTFGSAMVPPAIESLNGRVILYALLSLTVVRLIPMAVSLIGTGLQYISVGFIGWFGPRGIASIIYGLILLEEVGQRQDLFNIMVITVLISIFAHGLTAFPAVAWYSRRLREIREQTEDPMPEFEDIEQMPSRTSYEVD